MQIQNAVITGSFSYNGVDISSVTSSTSNITSLNAITASILSTTASLNTASGSAITRLSALEVTSGSNITRISALETASGSAITRLGALEVTSGSNITRIGALETASGSAITRLSSIEVVTGSNITRLSSLEAKTGSYATTGSNTFIGSQVVSGSIVQSGSFTTTGTIIAQTINVQTVTSSIVYSSGSNIFGNLLNNTQTFTGSVLVTGSLTIAGASSATSYSGTTIYGSTAVCSPTGYFSGCVGIGTATPKGLLHLYGAEVAAYKTYTGQGNTGGGDTIINAYRLDGSNAYLRVTDIVALGDDTNNRGSSIRLMTTNTSGVTSAALTLASTGYVGIGTTTPCAYLHINGTPGQNNPSIRLTDCSATGNGGNVYISADKPGVGYNNLTTIAYSHTFKGGGSATPYLTIDSNGVSCFANTVCATSINSSASSTLNGLLVSCNVNSNCFTGITVYNGAGAGSEASRAGIAFQAYDWVQSAIWHGRNTAAAFSGALLFGTNPDTTNLTVGGVCTRLKIDNYGIACFSCQVCAPRITIPILRVSDETTFGLTACKGPNSYPIFYADGAQGIGFLTAQSSTFGERLRIFHTGEACFACQLCAKSLTTTIGGLTENFDSTGGGHVNRYFAVKYIPENTTSAFFRITTSGASATYVHLAGTNAGVGWYSGQIYHAANSAYWGGWIGSGASVSLVGTSAGYISGVYSDGAGGQNYCVTVANNGTGTSSLIWAYITTITYAGYSTSFTQL